MSLWAVRLRWGIVPPDRHIPRLSRRDRANVGGVAIETHASAGFQLFRLFGGHCSLSSSNRTPTPLPFLAGKNSTPAFSKVRRIVVRLSSRGSRLSISNSATVDRPTPDSFANRRCDHCKSPLAARHCCEFMVECKASRYPESAICSWIGDKRIFKILNSDRIKSVYFIDSFKSLSPTKAVPAGSATVLSPIGPMAEPAMAL
jgi:hypothetical protein